MVWKYTDTSIFFLEKLIGQWILDRNRQGIARDIKKNISIFKTWQKMVTKFGQFKSFSSVLQFFCCWIIQNRQFFLEKLIGQWIPDRDGRGIARHIKKNHFHFQNLTKNGKLFMAAKMSVLGLILYSYQSEVCDGTVSVISLWLTNITKHISTLLKTEK